jgi:hypothetical protein
MSLPDKIPIRWMPDLHTSHIGHLGDSEQFFVAEHLLPSVGADSPSRQYVALYCFDEAGMLTSHKILRLLHLDTGDTVNVLMAQLGAHQFTDICVSPFQVAFDDRLFGLIPDAERLTISLEPGSMITFMEPWDGEYYT